MQRISVSISLEKLFFYRLYVCVLLEQARSQGGGGRWGGRPLPQNVKKGGEREKKGK